MSRPCDRYLQYNRPIHVPDKMSFLTDPTIQLTITTKTKSGGLAETNPNGLKLCPITIVYYLIIGVEQWQE